MAWKDTFVIVPFWKSEVQDGFQLAKIKVSMVLSFRKLWEELLPFPFQLTTFLGSCPLIQNEQGLEESFLYNIILTVFHDSFCAYKDSCDYTGSAWIIQSKFPILRSAEEQL